MYMDPDNAAPLPIHFEGPVMPRPQSLLCGYLLLFAAATCCTAQEQSAAQSSPAVLLHQAIGAAQTGHTSLALQMAQQITTTYPTYEPALKFEGALLQSSGDDEGASKFFEKAFALDPNDPELLFSVGVSRLATKHYADAATLLRKGAQLAPDDSQMFFYLAQAEHLAGDEDKALVAAKRSVELEPGNGIFLQKYGQYLSAAGNSVEAAAVLKRAQLADPTLDGIDYDLALASVRSEDLDAAATYAEAATKKHPDDLKLLRLHAEITVKLGRWPEARVLLEQILTTQPQDTAAQLELGRCEVALKQYKEAVGTLEAASRQDPTSALAHFYLARAYAGLGDKEKAAHQNELHRQLNASAEATLPEQTRAAEKATLQQARALLQQNNEPGALALFRLKIKGPLNTPGEPLLLVGVSYLYMDRLQDAERCLRQASAVQPDLRDAHTYLGVLAIRRGDLPAAEEQLQTELKAHPESDAALAELGEVRYQQERWEQAAKNLAQSHTASPALLYMLTDSYFHLGDEKQALVAAELAADYGKDEPAQLARLSTLLKQHGQEALALKLTDRP